MVVGWAWEAREHARKVDVGFVGVVGGVCVCVRARSGWGGLSGSCKGNGVVNVPVKRLKCWLEGHANHVDSL